MVEVEFAKRPEITVETMGRVHNPSGEGIKAVSSQAKAKKNKIKEVDAAGADGVSDDHETKVKEGTSKRNIIRRKRKVRFLVILIHGIKNKVVVGKDNGRTIS